MKKPLILFILFFISNQCLFAQKSNSEYIKNFFILGGDIATAPAHFDKHDFVNLGITSAIVAGAFLADNSVREFAGRNHSGFNDGLLSIDKYALGFSVVSIGGIGGYGLIANDYKAKELGLKLAEAVCYSELIGEIIKITAGRSRPYTGKGHTDFNPFNLSDDKNSFPSNHTIFAFAFARVMAGESNNIFWKAGWYTLAAVMAGARSYHDMHWLSDLALGACIGYFVGDFTVNHYTNKKDNTQNYTLSFKVNL